MKKFALASGLLASASADCAGSLSTLLETNNAMMLAKLLPGSSLDVEGYCTTGATTFDAVLESVETACVSEYAELSVFMELARKLTCLKDGQDYCWARLTNVLPLQSLITDIASDELASWQADVGALLTPENLAAACEGSRCVRKSVKDIVRLLGQHGGDSAGILNNFASQLAGVCERADSDAGVPNRGGYCRPAFNNAMGVTPTNPFGAIPAVPGDFCSDGIPNKCTRVVGSKVESFGSTGVTGVKIEEKCGEAATTAPVTEHVIKASLMINNVNLRGAVSLLSRVPVSMAYNFGIFPENIEVENYSQKPTGLQVSLKATIKGITREQLTADVLELVQQMNDGDFVMPDLEKLEAESKFDANEPITIDVANSAITFEGEEDANSVNSVGALASIFLGAVSFALFF